MSFLKKLLVVNTCLSLIILSLIYITCNHLSKDTYFYSFLFNQNAFLRPKRVHLSVDDSLQFDVIIIGGGTSGSVLANRASGYNSSVKVLVIEAGTVGNGQILSEIPGLAPLLWSNKYTHMSWDYGTQKQEFMLNRSLKWPSGKVLGGSSVINFMLFSKIIPSDFNRWAIVCPQWKWDSVHEYFAQIQFDSVTRVENNQLGNMWQSAIAEEKQIKTSEKKTKLFVKHGKRWSVAKEHMYEASLRDNVNILSETQVEKLIINANRVSEIVIRTNKDQVKTIKAFDKVILSAGTIQNVRILTNTFTNDDWIQPKTLKDHLFVPLFFEICNSELLGYSFSPMEAVKSLLKYLFNGSGPLAHTIFNGGSAFLNTTGLAPNIQLMFAASLIDEVSIAKIFAEFLDEVGLKMYKKLFEQIQGKNKHGFSVFVVLTRPKSSGSIRYTNDEFQINPNYLANNEDLLSLTHSIRTVLDLIYKAKAFSHLNIRTLQPQVDCGIDVNHDYWSCYAKSTAYSLFHYFGTYPLGGAQVDCNLRVNILNNLFMVDASVIPTLSSGNMQATVMMIAEKFAKEMLFF